MKIKSFFTAALGLLGMSSIFEDKPDHDPDFPLKRKVDDVLDVVEEIPVPKKPKRRSDCYRPKASRKRNRGKK